MTWKFGQLLIELMRGNKSAGRMSWTNEALASEINVTPETISNWRNARAWPPPQNYASLLTALGLNRDSAGDQETITSLDAALDHDRRRRAGTSKQRDVQEAAFLHFATMFPSTPTTPVLRNEIDQWLSRNIVEEGARLCVIFAGGGAGKTTTVRTWVTGHADRLQERFERTYVWSFYRQGQTAEFVSVDVLFDDLIAFLQLDQPSSNSTRAKMHACLEELSRRSILLVIDGIEALQYPPGDAAHKVGRFKDEDAQEFFGRLAQAKSGCVLATSRIQVAFPDRETNEATAQVALAELTDRDALSLLRSYGIEGSDEDLIPYVTASRWHPLILSVVANFIRRAYKNRPPTLEELRLDVPIETADAVVIERVLDGYLSWLPPPETALLVLFGPFDEPVSNQLIHRLGTGLITYADFRFDELQSYRAFLFRLETLKQTGLVFDDEAFPDLVDIHPMVKHYLGGLLRKRHPDLWRAANRAAFALTADSTDGLMALRRVVFGCRGDLAQRAFDEVYAQSLSRSGGLHRRQPPVTMGRLLYALSAFFDGGFSGQIKASLSRDTQQIIFAEVIGLFTELRGYAHPELTGLMSRAKEVASDNPELLLRILYSECRFNRMAGNLVMSKRLCDDLMQRAEHEGNASLFVGAHRNASAYEFYVGNFQRALQLAKAGEARPYRRDWRADALGFVNNPLIMLPGYAALAAAMLGDKYELAGATERMRSVVRQGVDGHSEAMASFIEAMLSDLGANEKPLAEAAKVFERKAAQSELGQWLIAANILRASVHNADPPVFEGLIRRWADTGARLFLPYWYAIAGETAHRNGDAEYVQNFSARGLAQARLTGETWVNERLQKLSLAKQ